MSFNIERQSFENGREAVQLYKDTVAKSLQDFEIGDVLGSGAYGHVLLAYHKEKKKLFAIKLVNRLDARGRPLPDLSREGTIHGVLHHPSILELENVFVDEYHIYLVLQYMEKGSLLGILEDKNAPLDEPTAKLVLGQVGAGLGYLRQMTIIHRDIKPANILVGHDDSVKIADFGSACKVKHGEELQELIGTTPYVAPEVIGLQPYSYPVDCWSLGAVFLEVTHFQEGYISKSSTSTSIS